ncbi:hypothetical protein PG994_000022 [Apiospora phragmitis]|uniref:FAD-binding domain-containing protein n=1 Tax=Apiospora phragmitis TaxID=2905665 RepID=A0ABR1X549_9PEZI
MRFSILDMPCTNNTCSNGTAMLSSEIYNVQLTLSWLRLVDEDEIPESNSDRLKQMRVKAADLSPTFARVIQDIGDDVKIKELELVDWVPDRAWDNHGGLVTLAGSAAHPMVLSRGDAMNHGILNAYRLVQAITSIHKGEKTQKEAIDAYEHEMRRRTASVVVLSRKAFIGEHVLNASEDSQVVRRSDPPVIVSD